MIAACLWGREHGHMKRLLHYLTNNHILANFTFCLVLLGGTVAWLNLSKEELPEFEVPWLRITVPWPGASAEDVELLVTKPLEEKIRPVAGIEEVNSTSANGSSSIQVSIDPGASDRRDIINNIKNAAWEATLPDGISRDLKFFQFRSAEKAVIDIGIFYEGATLLDTPTRRVLQEAALALENRLAGHPRLSGVVRSGYLNREIRIRLIPERLDFYRLTPALVAGRLRKHHFRVPGGHLEDKGETRLTLISEYETVERLQSMVVRKRFDGQKVLLSDIATVEEGFEDTNSIRRIQGHEAIILNVKKNRSYGILEARAAIDEVMQSYLQGRGNSPVRFIMLDDESHDLRNRLAIVTTNGAIGFVLILIVLFIFLDFRSGFWVSMGIPFCLCFTLIGLVLTGQTVNNVTLAAVIIVLGIVVDDAIIVTESVSRRRSGGLNLSDAAVEGTSRVLLPIVAAILTTCAAFVPLYYFSGRFGNFVRYIPLVVFLMLGASLYESILILPAHLSARFRSLRRRLRSRKDAEEEGSGNGHWFFPIESWYARVLARFVRLRWLVLLGFVGLLAFSGWLFQKDMKFVMFPREEAREVFIRAIAPPGTGRIAMAKLTSRIENIILQDLGTSVVGVRTSIGQSRRGGRVRENQASLRIEMVPREERGIPLRQILKSWKEKTDRVTGFQKILYIKSRFGRGSGSPIDILVRENNDADRLEIADRLETILSGTPGLANVEIEKPLMNPEVRLQVRTAELERLGIDPASLSTAIRTWLQGAVLYRITSGEEDVEVRLTIPDSEKTSVQNLLGFKVENQQGYLVPAAELVTLQQSMLPVNIPRTDNKRTIRVLADMADGTSITPLDIAAGLEKNHFPGLIEQFPTAILSFGGEVEDSRSSGDDFLFAALVVAVLIYDILLLLYRSLFTPLLIMAIVPFGLVGVILAFRLHGMLQFGFFAVVGTIGMVGVVINDAIVMVDQLEKSVHQALEDFNSTVAAVAATRLRAVCLTTFTTVAGLFPTAYGIAGYDAMLAEMMLAMGWGLVFATSITLLLVPCLYAIYKRAQFFFAPGLKEDT